ncbi:MAG: hypothetical protein IPP51_04720 [Bacteroidetes bacterium]|nr:hypothetical protein [Bacteroidota bacterium]
MKFSLKELLLSLTRKVLTRIFPVLLFWSAESVFAQTILNGSFETNLAGADQVNLTNAAFNSMVTNLVAFGTYGDMDLISSATYCGGPPNGSWYVALTGAGTDAFSMKLSSPLNAGTQYTLNFADHGCGAPYSIGPCPVQIGISTTSATFGTLVYTAPLPAPGMWVNRSATFTAPVSGQFITVQLSGGGLSNWTQVDNFVLVPTPLPIELLSFTAQLEDNHTNINWETATEINNDHFEIERSGDAQNFTSIEQLPGSGTTTISHSYSIKDFSVPEGIVYYRLKQVDFDGKYTYSEKIAIDNTKTKSLSFFVSFAGSSSLLISLSGTFESEYFRLTIYSMSGQIVYSNSFYSNNLSEIRLDKPLTGIYSLELATSTNAVRKLFAVLE